MPFLNCKNLLNLFLVLALAAFVCGTPARADILNFDDLSVTQNPLGVYNGVNFGGQWSYGQSYDSYNAHSANGIIYNYDYGTGTPPQDAAFTFSTPVVFDGAWFAGPNPVTIEKIDYIITINFELYLGGVLQASSNGLTPSATPTFLDSGYSGLVNEVRVHDTGAAGVYDYYAMDDVTFNSTAVPEPSSVLLFSVIAIGLGGALRLRLKA